MLTCGANLRDIRLFIQSSAKRVHLQGSTLQYERVPQVRRANVLERKLLKQIVSVDIPSSCQVYWAVSQCAKAKAFFLFFFYIFKFF